eukprot:5461222-Alexandrium_andersonii.AAC.1
MCVRSSWARSPERCPLSSYCAFNCAAVDSCAPSARCGFGISNAIGCMVCHNFMNPVAPSGRSTSLRDRFGSACAPPAAVI